MPNLYQTITHRLNIKTRLFAASIVSIVAHLRGGKTLLPQLNKIGDNGAGKKFQALHVAFSLRTVGAKTIISFNSVLIIKASFLSLLASALGWVRKP